MSALSKSCYYHFRELRCICPYLDFKTASTTAIVHSKLDYCNSYHNLLNYQLNRLQRIQNSLAHVVVKALKSSHIILKSLHWLKVNEHINYKLLSVTYKVLTTSKPSYLNNLISVQSPRRTCSSSVVTLSRHSDMHHPISEINSLIHSISLASHVSTHLLIHLLAHLYYHHHSITPSLFHSVSISIYSRLKTYLFNKSSPP